MPQWEAFEQEKVTSVSGQSESENYVMSERATHCHERGPPTSVLETCDTVVPGSQAALTDGWRASYSCLEASPPGPHLSCRNGCIS